MNLTPLFTPTWFSDAFIALFGYPCYILTQCGIYFSTFLFVQATLTLIVKLYKTISIKYNLKNNITLFSSIAHGFFNVLTARMVNDLNGTQNNKPKSTLLKSISLDNFVDTSTNLINHSTDVTSLPPFYTKRPNKIQFPKFNLFPKRHHNSHQKTAPLPFSPVQHPPLPIYTHKNFHSNDNLTTQHDTLVNNPVTSNTDTPLKIYSRITILFLLHLLEHSLSFLQTIFQHTCLLLLFTIATPPPLETLAEVHLPQSNNTSLIITIFKYSSPKVDKSTR